MSPRLGATLLHQFEAAEPPTATHFNLQSSPAGLEEDVRITKQFLLLLKKNTAWKIVNGIEELDKVTPWSTYRRHILSPGHILFPPSLCYNQQSTTRKRSSKSQLIYGFFSLLCAPSLPKSPFSTIWPFPTRSIRQSSSPISMKEYKTYSKAHINSPSRRCRGRPHHRTHSNPSNP